MKLSTLVLAGSLAANVVLLSMIAVGSSSDAGSTTRAPREKPAAKSSASGEAAAPGPEAWAELQTDDLSAQRDRLRAAGFPPELVRAILAAQVRENFAARRKAIEQSQGEIPFWKNPIRDPKMQAALRELGKEQEKILKDLLGRDARDDDPTYTAYLHRQFANLPDEKVDRLRQIMTDFDQQRSDIYANARNGLLPDEQKKMTELDKAMRAEFATVMTPDELTDYDLRSSNTAQQLRYNLTAFDATEPEYRAIYKLQAEFDEKYGRMYGPSTQDEMKARMDAQKQLTEDIKSALGGGDRATAYERATDYSYRQTTQLVARLELPPETAANLWNTQKEFEKRRMEIYNAGSAMPPAERAPLLNAQLTALQQEAVVKLTPLLGGDASRVEIYKQNGGQWLQSLAPRPPIPPPSR